MKSLALLLQVAQFLGVHCFFWEGVSAETNVYAMTKAGETRGIQEEVFGKKVNCFLGIPYAEPPQGKLRFRAPRKAQPWQGKKRRRKTRRVWLEARLGRPFAPPR